MKRAGEKWGRRDREDQTVPASKAAIGNSNLIVGAELWVISGMVPGIRSGLEVQKDAFLCWRICKGSA